MKREKMLNSVYTVHHRSYNFLFWELSVIFWMPVIVDAFLPIRYVLLYILLTTNAKFSLVGFGLALLLFIHLYEIDIVMK